MIGMVLAAGAGRRLGDGHRRAAQDAARPSTATARSSTSRSATSPPSGSTEAVVVTGFAAERIDERARALCSERHGAAARDWSSTRRRRSGTTPTRCGARASTSPRACCSPTATRSTPRRSRRRCWTPRGTADLVIALDDVKPLGEEEMKVHVTADGHLDRINKALDPASAQGEYIGVTLIEPARRRAARRRARGHLASATRSSTTRTASRSSPTAAGASAIAPIGAVEWVEVDDHADLARAREVACRC